jgi:hypothetical protein
MQWGKYLFGFESTLRAGTTETTEHRWAAFCALENKPSWVVSDEELSTRFVIHGKGLRRLPWLILR